MVRHLPVARSERRTFADTGNSRRFCLPARGRRICAAGAYWPGQTLWREKEREREREHKVKVRGMPSVPTQLGLSLPLRRVQMST